MLIDGASSESQFPSLGSTETALDKFWLRTPG